MRTLELRQARPSSNNGFLFFVVYRSISRSISLTPAENTSNLPLAPFPQPFKSILDPATLGRQKHKKQEQTRGRSDRVGRNRSAQSAYAAVNNLPLIYRPYRCSTAVRACPIDLYSDSLHSRHWLFVQIPVFASEDPIDDHEALGRILARARAKIRFGPPQRLV